MNEYKLELIARHRPEVLERILRVTRHRGFTVTTMEMTLIGTCLLYTSPSPRD